MGEDSRGTRKPRPAREGAGKEPVPETISPERPTAPIVGSSERAEAFEAARRDSAKDDKEDKDETRDVHRRPTVRRRVFK
jgi:hypothetical protein